MKKWIFIISVLLNIFLGTYVLGQYIGHSWWLNAELGSIDGIGKDYCIQVTNDKEVLDLRQKAPECFVMNNVTKYKILGEKNKIFIACSSSDEKPCFYIYDEKKDQSFFVNYMMPYPPEAYVGGNTVIDDINDKRLKAYRKEMLNDNNWNNL